jgi:hypothetical protein
MDNDDCENKFRLLETNEVEFTHINPQLGSRKEQKRDSTGNKKTKRQQIFKETSAMLICSRAISNLLGLEQRLRRNEAAKTLKKHKFSAFM